MRPTSVASNMLGESVKQDSLANGDAEHRGSMNKRTVAYRITVSIIFGLLGFVINFVTISFSFPPYTATVLIGLLFPMLITLAWGWKYGFLAALVGGCQSMWWLWGPSNGYATFLVVPPFTLWIVWHGLIANMRRKQKHHKWLLDMYVVEIPFRILSTISLFTLARLAITFNPPPWSWASSAINVISLRFSIFVVVKQAIVGCVILLLADVILSFRSVRRFFGLEKDRSQKSTNRIISIALLLGFLFWIIDSVVSSSVFHPENSFLDALVLNVSPSALYVRTFFILSCLVGGLLAVKLLRRQRASDRALQESEDTYRLLADNAIDVIWQIDLKLVFTYASPSVRNIMGYTVEEWVGTRLSQHATRKEFFNMARKALHAIKQYKESKHLTFEARMLRKDGTEIPVEVTGKVLFNNKGLPIGLQGTTRDITKRVQAEKLLQEAHNIISQSPAVAFLWKNEEGYPVEYASDNVKDLYGYTVEELTSGKIGYVELIHPDDLEKVKGAVAAHSKGKESTAFSHVPYRIVTKSGTTKWVDDRTTIRRDNQGQITHYQAIISDITKRRTVEQALQESEKHLQTLIDAMPDFVCFKDDDGRWLIANEAGIRVFQLEGIDYQGKKDSELAELNSKLRNSFLTCKETDARVWKAGSSIHGEEMIPDADGSVRIFDVTKVPVSYPGGKRKGIVVLGHDITERKQAEERTKRLLDQQVAINELSMALGEKRDLDSIYHTIYKHVSRMMDTQEFSISLFDDAQQLIHAEFLVYEGIVTDVSHFSAIPLKEEGRGAQSQVIRTGKTISWPNWRAAMEKADISCAFDEDGKTAKGSTPEDFDRESTQSEILVPMKIEGAVIGVLQVQSRTAIAHGKDDVDLLAGLANVAAIAIQNTRLNAKSLADAAELRAAFRGTIEALAHTTETRDPYTFGHQMRVTELAFAIAEELRLPTETIESIRISAMVHDIGKMAVPAEILSKPSTLTEIEYRLIQAHVQTAYDILKTIDFPWPVADIVLQHHERLDGSGYPNGIKGDEILFEARIICVADVVEAMSSHRPYRPALGIDAALEEIKSKKGIHYDPDVVDACVRLFADGFSFSDDDEA